MYHVHDSIRLIFDPVNSMENGATSGVLPQVPNGTSLADPSLAPFPNIINQLANSSASAGSKSPGKQKLTDIPGMSKIPHLPPIVPNTRFVDDPYVGSKLMNFRLTEHKKRLLQDILYDY